MNRSAAKIGYQLVAFYTPAAIEVSAPGQLPYLPESLDFPLLGEIDLEQPYRLMAQAAHASNIPLLDPRDLLREAANNGHQLYSKAYWHWTDEGHAAAATALQRLLADAGLLPSGCRQP